jgi:4'-phosphopantetheinyl transferase
MAAIRPVGPPTFAHSGAVQVHVTSLEDCAGPLKADEAILSDDENARAARFVFEQDRVRFVRARAFLRRSLAKAIHGCGEGASELRFVVGPHGKPEIDGGPDFNLSHSGLRDGPAWAALAISRSGPVGVDIEYEDRDLDPMALAGSVLVEAERKALDQVPLPQRRRRFLEYWTAKEARMKLSGEGMSLAPRNIELSLNLDGSPDGVLALSGRAVSLVALTDLPGPLVGYLATWAE